MPKQLLEIAGSPIIEYSIAAFDSCPDIDEVLVMMVPGFTDEVERIVEKGGYGKVSRVLEGGASRSASTCRAITALADEMGGECNVLLHDAVRPLVDHATIAGCAHALQTHEAATVAVASSDTVLVVDGDVITDIPGRTTLRRAQTPQGFRLATIRAAYERAMADPGFVATDDAAVVLRYLPDVRVPTVPGSENNIKVTHAGDIALAETLLELDG